MVLPNFLVCGAQKSGTTTLKEQIRQHPDVFMPKNELHFFISKKEGLMGNWEKGIEWYEKQFRDWDGESAVGEKTPGYIYISEIPKRIKSVVPNAKLIFILRHPVNRAYSHYWMKKRNGIEKRDFDEAISNGETDYLEKGLYVEQLKRFEKYFDKNQMVVFTLKELKDRPDNVYKGIFEFIGVKNDFIPQNPYKKYYRGGVNRSEHLASIRRRFKRKNLWQIAKIINLINVKGQMTEYLSKKDTKSYPPMKIEIRKKLIHYFEPYNKELEKMYPDLNIKHWYR